MRENKKEETNIRKIITEYFPKLMKDINPKLQETQQTHNRI